MPRPIRRRPFRAIAIAGVVAGVLAGLTGPVSPARAATEFPAGYEAFHTYAEMVADIRAVQAARSRPGARTRSWAPRWRAPGAVRSTTTWRSPAGGP